MKKFVIIFLISFLFLLAECQPEKTFHERAQEAYDAVKEKAQEIFDSMHQATKEAMESARSKWQELMDSSNAPPPTTAEGSDATGQDWISAGKNYISNIMGIGTTARPVPGP